MRLIFASFGGLALAVLATGAVGSAGMGEPVMEGEIVVVETPVMTQPVYTEDDQGGSESVSGDSTTEPETESACSADACAPLVANVGDSSGDDRTPQEQQISQTADGRVLCLTVPAARRGGAGLFDLFQP